MKKMNLFGLLNNYCVEIPFLQRNYVHGANNSRSEEIRKHFVNEFIKLLEDPTENPVFNLNFIFGEERSNDIIIPIDGQQRLTTLWLLAAFIINRNSDKVGETDSLRMMLEKFSYAGRPLAAFASKLIVHGATSQQLKNLGLCSDVTTSAMVQTLETFASDNRLSKYSFDDLINALKRVVFEFEYINQDADKTYIKMNARGKTLTQWENFKGKFSELLNDAKSTWDQEIEKATDCYITLQDSAINDSRAILPDDPFFSFVARILLYEACKDKDKKRKEAIRQDPKIKNLVLLTKHSFESRTSLPFVPFDEFQYFKESACGVNFDSVAKRIIIFLLQIVQNQFFKDKYYPYWKKEKMKTLWETILKPNNEREQDFGLVLYEYTNHEQFKGLLNSRAIRLITNIIENDSSDDRVKHCIAFFDNGPTLYGTTATIIPNTWQEAEELQKGYIYSTPGCIVKMQELENVLHGRIRIAILDLTKGVKESLVNISEINRISFRINKVLDLLETWESATNNDERKRIFFDTIIPNLDWSIPDSIKLNFEPSGLMDMIHTGNDVCLQRNLIDGNSPNNQEKYPFEEHGGRDWRKVLLEIFKTDELNEDESQRICKENNTIRWHHYSGRYYLYTTAIITHAYPISDYRIDVLFDQKFADSVWNIRYPDKPKNKDDVRHVLQMNDAATTSFRMKNNLQCYFFRDEIHVRAYDDHQGKILKDEKCSYSIFKNSIPSFLQYISEINRDDFLNDFSLQQGFSNHKSSFLAQASSNTDNR